MYNKVLIIYLLHHLQKTEQYTYKIKTNVFKNVIFALLYKKKKLNKI